MTGAVIAQCGGGIGPSTLLGIIQELGLTSGLQICLDAADSASYGGSGQTWSDRSGNGFDFFRGTTSGSEASDPTFNGTAGGLSANEYWSYDGADLHTYDSAVEAFMSAMHQDNAEWTVLLAFYVPSGGGSSSWIFGTMGNAPNDGVAIFVDDSVGNVTLQVRNGAPTLQTNVGVAALSAWNVTMVALDEGVANGSTFRTNAGVQADVTVNYTTPSVDAASPMKFGAANGVLFSTSGTRIAMAAVWTTRLSNTALTNLYQRIKLRRPGYGLP